MILFAEISLPAAFLPDSAASFSSTTFPCSSVLTSFTLWLSASFSFEELSFAFSVLSPGFLSLYPGFSRFCAGSFPSAAPCGSFLSSFPRPSIIFRAVVKLKGSSISPCSIPDTGTADCCAARAASLISLRLLASWTFRRPRVMASSTVVFGISLTAVFVLISGMPVPPFLSL